MLAAPAAVAVLLLGGLAVRSCGQDPDTTTLATSSEPADPADPGTTGTTGIDSVTPGGSDSPTRSPLRPVESPSTTGRTPTTPARQARLWSAHRPPARGHHRTVGHRPRAQRG